MARVGQETAIHKAAKMVIVDGTTQSAAAKAHGIDQPNVSVAVKRIKKITAQALEFAECMNKKGKK